MHSSQYLSESYILQESVLSSIKRVIFRKQKDLEKDLEEVDRNAKKESSKVFKREIKKNKEKLIKDLKDGNSKSLSNRIKDIFKTCWEKLKDKLNLEKKSNFVIFTIFTILLSLFFLMLILYLAINFVAFWIFVFTANVVYSMYLAVMSFLRMRRTVKNLQKDLKNEGVKQYVKKKIKSKLPSEIQKMLNESFFSKKEFSDEEKVIGGSIIKSFLDLLEMEKA